MVANPTTGVLYEDGFELNRNEEAIRKAPIVAFFMRDYNGVHTNLRDPSVGVNANGDFTPFAKDGKPRDDLLITASGTNQGWYDLASLAPAGLTYSPNVSQSETMTAQSRSPARIDITREDDRIRVRARESTPIIDVLRYNLPLASLQDIGSVGYSLKKPTAGKRIERQGIAWMFDGNHFAAQVFPRLNRTDVGETQWNLDDPDDLDQTWTAVKCPWAKSSVLLFREGDGWRAMGGFPSFGLSAPVAAPTSTTTATVTHAIPTGTADPWVYVVEKSTNAGTSWAAATVGSSTPSGGNIVHAVTGLSAVPTVFRVKATGTNELTGTSATSNSITPA